MRKELFDQLLESATQAAEHAEGKRDDLRTMTVTGYVIRDEYDQTSKAVVVAEDSTKALALAIEQGIEAHEDPSDLYAVAVPIIWPEGGWTV